MKSELTRSQIVGGDVAALFRARNPVVWIVTREEARVERHLMEAAASANYEPIVWDVAQGCARIDGTKLSGNTQDPGDALALINSTQGSRRLWILRDMPIWLAGPPGAAPLRMLRNLARKLPGLPRDSAQSIVIITPSSDVPPELAGHTTVIEWPLPDRREIASILDAAIDNLPEELQKTAAPNGQREAAVDAAVGLNGEEAAACYAKSLVQLRRIDPVAVAKEKKRVIARERVLEWYDPIPGGLDSVGGLDILKDWLCARASAFTPQARKYGLPAPKGALLVGVPGCGKSLTAKAIATAWGIPLLRFDLGALKDKYVGSSEGNIRKAFQVIETIGRCVVWIDEIEKAMAGATQGAADGGVSSDQLGAILSWMQERQGEAFVIATANDISSLPPELLRKGRFDQVWFVDLPNWNERIAVLQAALNTHGRGDADIDFESVCGYCDQFTGAEISALVPDAMFTAFADKEREITTTDLVKAAKTVVPLAKTAGEKISKLRSWAKENARPATSAVTENAKSKSRVLDI